MQIKTYTNQFIELDFPDCRRNSESLLALPAVIDPHVHFRTPGLEHKEDWLTGAKVALRGGCTMVFDMPNTLPPAITAERMREKRAIIDQQLQAVGIPLKYQLYFGADKNHMNEIARAKSDSIGIKVFMGCSTGNLVIDDDESLHAVFATAARENMLVAVHAEDEQLIQERKKRLQTKDAAYAIHSHIRNVEVAVSAVAKAIALCAQYGTRLYILHVSSAEEIALIAAAKAQGLPVFAETTPHHLFFDDTLYDKLGGHAQVNPPLRAKEHRAALLSGIREGVIDTIGSDHAPHTMREKNQPYGLCPSGMPGLEFMLPALLNAYHQNLLTLAEIVALTSTRARNIFNLPDEKDKDWVIVDLAEQKMINHRDTLSKCGYTPYVGLTLKGWPRYTIMNNHVYDLNKL